MWKPETIKLLEENKSSILLDISLSKFAGGWCVVSSGKDNQRKQRELIKLKRFYTEKETINKTKRQPSEWENILVIPDSELISKPYKEPI